MGGGGGSGEKGEKKEGGGGLLGLVLFFGWKGKNGRGCSAWGCRGVVKRAKAQIRFETGYQERGGVCGGSPQTPRRSSDDQSGLGGRGGGVGKKKKGKGKLGTRGTTDAGRDL